MYAPAAFTMTLVIKTLRSHIRIYIFICSRWKWRRGGRERRRKGLNAPEVMTWSRGRKWLLCLDPLLIHHEQQCAASDDTKQRPSHAPHRLR